jgi:SAM-dependent methyltransferase
MNDIATMGAPSLFWEAVSEGRWGQYISAIEGDMIRFAHQQLGEASTALEIGAEGGRWSKLLADIGWQMTCTEIDPEALAVCQQRIPTSRCVLVDINSREFPCETDSQKLVLAIEVHELVEQDWFVNELNRVLQDGGIFVGVFQNKHSWRAIMNLKSKINGTMQQYTAGFLPWKQKITELGFEILREEGICWMPFGRMSDSPLVPIATQLERALGLRKWTNISPWIVFAAKKTTRPDPFATRQVLAVTKH